LSLLQGFSDRFIVIVYVERQDLINIKLFCSSQGTGFETWQIEMKDGTSILGIISSRTASEIEIKLPGGINQKILTSTIKTTKLLSESMMPEGMHESMTKQELADIIQYMADLKKKG
jgi:putative heme-binding domain-containing protein